MNDTQRAAGSFVAYETREIAVNRQYAALYTGGFRDLGWEPDGAQSLSEADPFIRLRFRRDRRIINRMELTRLENQFCACMKDIERLERSRTSYAMAAALISGVTGLVLGVGAALAALQPMIWLAVLLGIPAVLLCALSMPLHNLILKRRTAETEPHIDAKYEEILALCDKARRLQDL